MRGGDRVAVVAAAVLGLGLPGDLPAQSLPAPILSDANIAPALRILKGELLEWNVRGLSGDLLVDAEEGPRRWRCRVTTDTFLSRASIRIHPAGVRVGDTLEIVAEGVPSSCVARTVYIRPPDPRLARKRIALSMSRSALDTLWPRGLLTFTGMVNRVEGNRLYLQTRKFGSKSFALRDDTIFSHAGRNVEPSDLGQQTRVFVRANRTYEGDLEVYHVVWGDILLPRRDEH
jgi:hypothetical protein